MMQAFLLFKKALVSCRYHTETCRLFFAFWSAAWVSDVSPWVFLKASDLVSCTSRFVLNACTDVD